MPASRLQLNLLEKAVALCSWGLAGAMFLTIGWLAIRPDDPLGAVSVLTCRRGLLMLVQAAAVSGVAAGIATAIAGRSLSDVGTFAAALGLAAVSLRGGTAGALMVQYAEVTRSFERSLALNLALESVGWFLVMAVAIGVSAFIMRRRFAGPTGQHVDSAGVQGVAARTMAGYDAPGMGVRLFGVAPEQQTRLGEGIKHGAITAVVGLVSMAVLSAGLSNRSIQHGQVCFVVAGAVCFASYVAYRLVPVRSSLWAILAVPVIAVAGYVWASVRPNEVSLPLSLPSSHFLRVLPIQYISIGTAAALTMFWSMYDPAHHAGRCRRSQAGKSSVKRKA